MAERRFTDLVFISLAILVSIGLLYLLWVLVLKELIQTLRSKFSQSSTTQGFGGVDGSVPVSEDQRTVRQVRVSHPPIRNPVRQGRGRIGI